MKRAGLRLTVVVLLAVALLLAGPVYAAKKRVRRTSSPRVTGIAYSRAQLSRATHSVIVTFLNSNYVRRVDYILSYTANGIQQGVVGSMVPSGQTNDGRDLYFGTCSKGVCTPHYNIQKATLTVTTTLTAGGTYTKRYLIKV